MTLREPFGERPHYRAMFPLRTLSYRFPTTSPIFRHKKELSGTPFLAFTFSRFMDVLHAQIRAPNGARGGIKFVHVTATYVEKKKSMG